MSNQNCHRLICLVLPATLLALSAGPAMAQIPAPAGPVSSPLPPPAVAAQQAGQPDQVLELTMEEAVALAMENNLGLQSNRLQLEIADLSIARARASFLPQTTATLSRNTTSRPAQLNADGTQAVTSTTGLNTSTGVSQQLPWFGTSYNVNWNAGRSETPGSNATFNPSLRSDFGFSITQPILSGLMLDGARAGLESSQRGRVITDLSVQQAQVQLDATVRRAYLNLVAAREGYNVALQNLEIAEQALRNSQARVDVGVAPETDVIGDQAQVASQRVQTISAEAQIASAEDELRRIIFNPARPDYWEIGIVPTDTIELTPQEISLEATIEEALANRLDLEIARRNLDLTDLNLQVAKDSTRPNLDFTLSYNASSSGGTSSVVDSRGFGNVVGQAFGGDYPSWTTALRFNYPIGRSSAEATFAQNQIQRRQEVMSLQELELIIVQQVRNAVRQVENNFRRVEAARAALDASQQNLDAENRRLAVGLSTSLDLQFRQQSLASARVSELNAIIAYNNALIELERVKRIR